jgi:hypothetical protein
MEPLNIYLRLQASVFMMSWWIGHKWPDRQDADQFLIDEIPHQPEDWVCMCRRKL